MYKRASLRTGGSTLSGVSKIRATRHNQTIIELSNASCSGKQERGRLKRALASRPSGEWNDDDFDVLADGVVVGRIIRRQRCRWGSPGCGRSPSGITSTPADARLRADARGRDGGVRQDLAAGVAQLRPTTEVEATSILPT